jgi:hypothetical protein
MRKPLRLKIRTSAASCNPQKAAALCGRAGRSVRAGFHRAAERSGNGCCHSACLPARHWKAESLRELPRRAAGRVAEHSRSPAQRLHSPKPSAQPAPMKAFAAKLPPTPPSPLHCGLQVALRPRLRRRGPVIRAAERRGALEQLPVHRRVNLRTKARRIPPLTMPI